MKQKKELSIDEEVNLQINRIFKQARINSLKKYLPNNIDVDPFPNEKKIKMKKMMNYLWKPNLLVKILVIY